MQTRNDPEEALLFLPKALHGETILLHLQTTDDGSWDYTIYAHPTHRLIDGGTFEEMPYHSAIEEIKKMHSLSQDILPQTLSLDLLEEIQDDAAI